MATFDLDIKIRDGKVQVVDQNDGTVDEVPLPGSIAALTNRVRVDDQYASVTDQNVPLPSITNLRALIVKADGEIDVKLEGDSSTAIKVDKFALIYLSSSSQVADGDLKVTTSSTVNATIYGLE